MINEVLGVLARHFVMDKLIWFDLMDLDFLARNLINNRQGIL